MSVTYEKISPDSPRHAEEHSVKSHVLDYWAARAEDFADLRSKEFSSYKHDAWLRELNRALPAGRRLRVLDVGTGSGFFALLLAETGHDATGIDLVPEMIDRARAASADLGIPARFEVMDAERTAFASNSFDVIVTRNLTWTLPHLEQAYCHWFDLLAPGGVLINMDGDYTHEKPLRELELPKNHAHKGIDGFLQREYEHIKEHLVQGQLVRPAWDVDLLREAGFESIEVDTTLSERLFADADIFYNPTPMFTIRAVKPALGKDAGEQADDALKADNLTYWTNRASGYSEVNQEELEGDQRGVWTAELAAQIGRVFPQARPCDLRVLEVGCGPGFFSIILTQAGYRVTATDYTQAMLDQARANAGELADAIDWQLMDAEDLSFADGSFDVVVCRNLTWNLPHPADAYAEWMRVLKPGGVLLVYDANWYTHLFDAQARADYEADRAATVAAGVKDEYAHTDIDMMEDIARQMPMSRTARPAWDLEVLGKLGLASVEADEAAWERVFSPGERINYASTPMFCVRAVK